VDARLRAAALLGAGLWGLGALRWAASGPVDPAPPPAVLEGATGLLWGRPIDLQRADAHTLEVLPGIGPVRARAIVETRCRQAFRTLADVDRVPGIGPRTVARLAGWAEVRDPRPGGCDAVPAPEPVQRPARQPEEGA
jgi:hypothetical protein